VKKKRALTLAFGIDGAFGIRALITMKNSLLENIGRIVSLAWNFTRTGRMELEGGILRSWTWRCLLLMGILAPILRVQSDIKVYTYGCFRSGMGGSGAGDVVITRMDGSAEDALSGVQIGQEIPDIDGDEVILRDGVYNHVRCKRALVSGNVTLKVLGALEIADVSPISGSATPPMLTIYHASQLTPHITVNFQVPSDRIAGSEWPRGGSFVYRGSGPPFSGLLSHVYVNASGGESDKPGAKGGDGGRVELAHVGRFGVSAYGGDGGSGKSLSTAKDGGGGGSAGSLYVKYSRQPGLDGSGSRTLLPTVDDGNSSWLNAIGGAGGYPGYDTNYVAGTPGVGGRGGTVSIDGGSFGSDTSFTWSFSVAGGRGGDNPYGNRGGDAGDPGMIPIVLAAPPQVPRAQGGAGMLERGQSKEAFVRGTGPSSIATLPDIPGPVMDVFKEWMQAAAPEQSIKGGGNGWTFDCSFGSWPSGVARFKPLGGDDSYFARFSIELLATVRGNSTNKISLPILLSSKSGQEANEYGSRRTFLEARYYVPAPYELLVTNRWEFEPLMIRGPANQNAPTERSFSIINSPLDPTFLSQKMRCKVSYGQLTRRNNKQQVLVVQSISPNNIWQFPILGQERGFSRLQLPGVKTVPEGLAYAPGGMLLEGIPADGHVPSGDGFVDNLHISDVSYPDLPGIWDYRGGGPLLTPRLAGCGSCFHMHWRWDSWLDDLVNPSVIFSGGPLLPWYRWDDAKWNGDYIRPKGSSQSMSVAVASWQGFLGFDRWLDPGFLDTLKGSSFPGSVEIGLLARSDAVADEFFQFGCFVKASVGDEAIKEGIRDVSSDPHLGTAGSTVVAYLGPQPQGTVLRVIPDGGLLSSAAAREDSVLPFRIVIPNASKVIKRAWLGALNFIDPIPRPAVAMVPIKVLMLDHFAVLEVEPWRIASAKAQSGVWFPSFYIDFEVDSGASRAVLTGMVSDALVYLLRDQQVRPERPFVDAWCSSGLLVASVPPSVGAVVEESEDLKNWKSVSELKPGSDVRTTEVSDWKSRPRFLRVTVPPGTFGRVVSTTGNAYAIEVTSQPQDAAVVEGVAAGFQVKVSGREPIRYQWQRDGVDIQGAQGPILSFSKVRVADAGRFRVVASNADGSVVSSAATLSVTRLPAVPVIVTQPQSVTVNEGAPCVFSVRATGEGLQYRWHWRSADGKRGGWVQGATGPDLSIPRVQSTDAAEYGVVVVSLGGGVTSEIVKLTVVRGNQVPILAVVPDATVLEGQSLNLTLMATDADLPPQTLVYSLVSGPQGLSVSVAGALRWVPSEAQGPSTNLVTVRVSDGMANTDRSFKIVVNEVNQAPVLAAVADQVLNEGTLLSLTLTATDADLPTQTLKYSKVNGPEGLGISANGQLTWTPTEAQGPSTNVVSVRVTDGVATVTNSLTLVVREVNTLPTLAGATNAVLNELAGYTQNLLASDSDLPAQALVVRLVQGPAGLVVTNGVLAWTPTEAQGPSTNVIRVSVSDGELPVVHQFSLVVIDSAAFKPTLLRPSIASGRFRFELGGRAGDRVSVQRSSDLQKWETVSVSKIPSLIEIPATTNNFAEYYRVVLIE